MSDKKDRRHPYNRPDGFYKHVISSLKDGHKLTPSTCGSTRCSLLHVDKFFAKLVKHRKLCLAPGVVRACLSWLDGHAKTHKHLIPEVNELISMCSARPPLRQYTYRLTELKALVKKEDFQKMMGNLHVAVALHKSTEKERQEAYHSCLLPGWQFEGYLVSPS